MTTDAAIPEGDATAQTTDVLARSGALEARLARTQGEIEAAQRLRFEVFYCEMNAQPTPEMAATRRDFDRYDEFCDHLLVFDHEAGDQVVGCYRLLRRAVAERNGGFYSASEYDLGELLARSPPDAKFLELGRSCVAKAYRSSQVLQFMWRGLLAYLIRNDIELMFGCASLPGIDPGEMKPGLSYLHHFCSVPPDLPQVRALPERYVEMNLIPKDQLNEQEAMHELPPLVKGYIRAGAYIGDGAVIDHQFNTTDVFIYFPTTRLDRRLLEFLTKRMKSGPPAPG
jgi:putative hemolysin